IIKNISEGMGNNKTGEITYYVQYVLIVTLIMTNFSETIVLIKETINNLVGFINCLLPILLALMITTGNIATASTIQPILLLVITFIGNFITAVLLPLVLIGTALRNSIKNIR
ncbi:MAG: stage III sporulation protein AE, partial [Clostridia bacterium]|nr:stage III sporulation protein AE [Clostridia bacterium]